MIRPAALAAVMMATLTACTASSTGNSATSGQSDLAGCRALTPAVAAHPDAASAARAAAALSRFAAVGWNPSAPPVRPSRLRGGVVINFRPTWDGVHNSTANINIQTGGDSDGQAGSSPRHDPLADLAILRDIDALQSTGTTTASLDRLRCKLQPVTAAEFATYGVERGWVYGELIDLSRLDPAGPWRAQARTFADTLANRFADGIDPTSTFRPDWVAESAAALTDAGGRFQRADWALAGHRLALELCRTSADPTTGFFPAQARLSSARPATVVDPLVKVGSQAQLVTALLSVYDDTHDHEILAAVRANLASLQSRTIGLADAVNGGWFYAVNVDGTRLRKNYKETRQAWLVTLFSNAADNGLVPAQLSQQLRSTVRERLYQPDSRGYVYRLRADWTPYTATQNGRRIQENWVSAEATAIAVQALLGPVS